MQWFIRPLAGSGVAEITPDAGQPYQPPAIRPEDILPGQTKQFRFTASKIVPGTVRDVTVFIPAQYDGKKPACVYMKTDGFNPGEKALLERMIATKEMPVTVGVFVQPGDLPAAVKGTAGRRNRDFEYDAVTQVDNHESGNAKEDFEARPQGTTTMCEAPMIRGCRRDFHARRATPATPSPLPHAHPSTGNPALGTGTSASCARSPACGAPSR